MPWLPQEAHDHQAGEAQQAEGQVIEALLILLTVWTTPEGEAIYIKHCRDQRGGCEAYVARVVEYAAAAAEAWEIPLPLLMAVGFHESGLHPTLEGDVGEVGIWQLNSRGAGARARRYARQSGLPDIYCQAFVAAQELRKGLEACHSISSALRFYNAGHCGDPGRYGRKLRTILERLPQ